MKLANSLICQIGRQFNQHGNSFAPFKFPMLIFIPMTNWDCPTVKVPLPSVLLPTTSMVCGPSERALMLKGGMPERDRKYIYVIQSWSLHFRPLLLKDKIQVIGL